MSLTTQLTEKLVTAIKYWHLFDSQDRVLLGVSGGIDSVVLLHLLLRLPKGLRPQVVVAHFNHRLRRESYREAKFVKNLCKQWSIPFYEAKAPPWKTKSNVEATARKLRYRFFKKTGARLGISRIVTAHQADDQAETFLMRWIQGAGIKGLGGIAFKREEGGFFLIRPMLLVRRSEIEKYARQFKIPYRTDLSNKTDLFLRNRLRKLLKKLKKENPNLAERASWNAILIQADQGFLGESVGKIFKKSSKKISKGIDFSLQTYQCLPQALRYRVLQRMAKGSQGGGGVLPAEMIVKMDFLLLRPSFGKKLHLPYGLRFISEKRRFKLVALGNTPC